MQHPSSRKAIAIIAVVTALVFLAMIGTPFLMSMILQKKSSQNFLNQTRARLAAQGALNFAIHHLAQGEYQRELERQIALQNSKTIELFSTPDFDTYLELHIPLPSLEKELSKNPKGLFKDPINWESSTSFDIANQKGVFWSVTVEDEQAKINLHSASPWLLGNLFGSTFTTDDVASTDTRIPVQSTANFNPQGGLLWFQGELISYEKTIEKAFLQCRRGLQAQLPEFDPARNIPRGSLIIDARAHKLSRHSYREIPGEFLAFLNTHQIKNIANYGRATLLPEEVDRLLPFLTVHSHRSFFSGFSQSNQLARPFRAKDQKEDIGSTLSLEFFGKYAVGTLVRIRHPLFTEYSRIHKVNGTMILLEDRLIHDYDIEKTRIDFGDPHPVNLNTAREEVLVALFTGIVFQGSNDPITREQAIEVARKLIESAYQNNFITSHQSFYDFLKALENLQILKSEQVHALYLNATDPYGQYQGRFLEVHTAPFCYKNEDIYSIRATGLVHSPVGVQIASHTLQEIVRVAPEHLQTKVWETQKDFFEAFPPESHKVVTWPTPIVDARSKPETSRHPDQGDVRILPSETLQADLHFSNTIEGQLGTHSHGSFPLGSNANITPGYTEFWIKSPESATGNYFGAISNQIEPGISVDQILLNAGKELELRLYDPCLGNKFSGIRFPYKLNRRVWYHLSLAWLNSRYGALSLFLDGVPVGTFDYFDASGHSLTTELTASIPDIQTKEIQVKSTRGFPDQGAILIGEEVIEYESKTPTSFRVWGFNTKVFIPPGFSKPPIPSMNNIPYPLGRAVRTSKAQIFPLQGVTTAKDFTQFLGIDINLLKVSTTWDGFSHEAGSLVLPFGYSTRLDGTNQKIRFSTTVSSVGTFDFSKIYLGKGTLKEPLKATSTPPAILLSALQPTDTSIPVVSTQGFPSSGYLVIGSELLFYASRNAQSFDGVKRGQGGTQAGTYIPNANIPPILIYLNSIQISNTQNYPDHGWIQIDFEWFGPYTKMGNYFIGVLSETNQNQIVPTILQRGGALGPTEHKVGAKVIPIFAVQTRACGSGDEVTIIDNQTDPNQRYSQQITWADEANFHRKSYFLVALNDFLPREILASNAGRVLKFPSGELPAQALQGIYGAPDPKIYDEIKVRTGTPNGFILPHPMSSQAKYFVSFVPIEAGRLIKIGNEILAAQKVENIGSQGNITFPAYLVGPLIRGAFNTPMEHHANGTPYFVLDYVPSSVLTNTLSSTSARVDLFQNASIFPNQGYLRIGKEVLGYTEKNGFTFRMPRKDKVGLFRRRFGTPKSSHALGDLVTFQPYRYWDCFGLESMVREINPYSLVFSSQNTLFRGMRWEEFLHRNRRLDIACLVRFDGTPDWNATPTNQKGGLFLLEDGNTRYSFGKQGIQANQIELRFLFRYHSGAFLSDIWKETPWLKKIELDYYAPTQVLQAEELRTN